MVDIVIASANEGKVREIRQILSGLPANFITLSALPEVVEDGETFAENARKKAVAVARHTGKWTLADDSGLEVDALGGAPGIWSARWSGGGPRANNEKMLAELRGVPAPARTARFRAAVALVSPEGEVLAEAEGVCEGVIGFEARGAGGFGYDPLFAVPEYGLTMAELDPAIKNRISHRGRALERLRDPLTRAIAAVR